MKQQITFLSWGTQTKRAGGSFSERDEPGGPVGGLGQHRVFLPRDETELGDLSRRQSGLKKDTARLHLLFALSPYVLLSVA